VQVYLSRLRKALHPAGTRDTDDGRVVRLNTTTAERDLI
jgi:hypothetical protein